MLSSLILLTVTLLQKVPQQATHHCQTMGIVPRTLPQSVPLQAHSSPCSLDRIMVKVVNLPALLLLRLKR